MPINPVALRRAVAVARIHAVSARLSQSLLRPPADRVETGRRMTVTGKSGQRENLGRNTMPSTAGEALPKNGAAQPRVVALVGPQGSGKTTLYESLMATAGAPVRRSGSARERTMTTELAFGHCQFLGDPWSIIDCPGSVEFGYETVCALEAADIAVVVCDPAPERAPAVAPLLRILEGREVPHLIFINKIDSFTGRLRDTLAALQGFSTRPLVLRQVPIRDGEAITGYVDVVSECAYRYRKGQPSERIAPPAELQGRDKDAFAGLVEVLADHDDGILEKIIEELTPTQDEIYRQLHKDQVSNAIVEVLLGAADGDRGTRRLWKALRHDCPGPAETAVRRGIAADGEPLLQVVKTVHAAHAGKLSYARIWAAPGSMASTRCRTAS
jgi:elongation factor G